MELIEYFTNHHAQLLYLLAGISFVVELTVMGLSGPLLFFALACFTTGILTSFGVLNGWESEVFSVGLLTGVMALLLWRPLRRFQNSGGGPDTSSDMIGKQVSCAEIITSASGSIRYSGANWSARLDTTHSGAQIDLGAQCVISGVDGNVMIVRPLL